MKAFQTIKHPLFVKINSVGQLEFLRYYDCEGSKMCLSLCKKWNLEEKVKKVSPFGKVIDDLIFSIVGSFET